MAPEPVPDLIGSLLDGRYRIVSLLARGGMGDVYVAEETRLKRRCALKVMHPALAEDRGNVERFLREAQMIAQLEHANIVDIYSYGEEPSGLVFFAMELLLGEDLDARLKARPQRPFSAHDVCAWGVQVAQAVAVVHDAGLIHRDLKVSNIFLARRRDGQEIVKLLDFGIARPEDNSELTKTGVSLGTPSYMSPEQIRNVDVDRRTDIYSFGVLLFKLLTGRLPFSGEPIQVAMAHCEAAPPRPSAVAPAAGISPELDALILKAMAKKPGDRFQSMREVQAALIAVLQAEAPELAPSRMPTQPHVDYRPPALQTGADSRLTPPPSASGTQGGQSATQTSAAALDPATSGSLAPPTGPTSAMSSAEPPGMSRWLYAITAASVLGVVVILAAVMLTGGDGPASVAGATKREPPAPMPAEPAPKVEAKPAPEPAPKPPQPVAAQPPQVMPPPITPSPPDEEEQLVKVQEQPKVAPKVEARPLDPMKQVEKKALACRRKHKAVDGPKISIDYAVGIDGKVTRSIPSSLDELGKCIADAVKQTTFEPKLVLGKKMSL